MVPAFVLLAMAAGSVDVDPDGDLRLPTDGTTRQLVVSVVRHCGPGDVALAWEDVEATIADPQGGVHADPVEARVQAQPCPLARSATTNVRLDVRASPGAPLGARNATVTVSTDSWSASAEVRVVVYGPEAGPAFRGLSPRPEGEGGWLALLPGWREGAILAATHGLHFGAALGPRSSLSWKPSALVRPRVAPL